MSQFSVLTVKRKGSVVEPVSTVMLSLAFVTPKEARVVEGRVMAAVKRARREEEEVRRYIVGKVAWGVSSDAQGEGGKRRMQAGMRRVGKKKKKRRREKV